MEQMVAGRSSEIPYARLTPDLVLSAVASAGFEPDGRVLALNSYENRVYQVGVEESVPVVVKFYRPGRWTRAAILEEHAFAAELAAAEVPVVAPLGAPGATLHVHHGYSFAIYPRRGGRWPDLDSATEREWMGRFLGRLHRVGSARPFLERARLDGARIVADAARTVLRGEWLPAYLVDRYRGLTDTIGARVADAFDACQPRFQRIHGDCHRGNILWTDAGPHFVDLDDCVTGPAIQDLWMLLDGTAEAMGGQLRDLLAGYEQFQAFDRGELLLIEPLRALRMAHYAGWLARRWHDPAFPRAFPWFGAPRYWEEHVQQLTDQVEALDAPVLRV